MARKKNIDIAVDEDIIIEAENDEIIEPYNNDIEPEIVEENIEAVINLKGKDYTINDLVGRVQDSFRGLTKDEIRELKEMLSNYISSFIYILFKKYRSVDTFYLLKKSLRNNENYYITLDSDCSNSKIKFSKAVIDYILEMYETIFITK